MIFCIVYVSLVFCWVCFVSVVSVVLVSDDDRKKVFSLQFWCFLGLRLVQNQIWSGCSASLCRRCDIRKAYQQITSSTTGHVFKGSNKMHSRNYNGTRACAKLVHLV